MRTPMSDPQRIGPYRIVGRLGSGGMGWVYLARSPSGRAVAVKVVRPEHAADPAFRQRFAREVAAARAVSGAFTAPVIDADAEGDPPWLATVHVPGPSLAEAVKEMDRFEEAQVRLLGAGLVEALQSIHAAGVVHRDLKPSNILLADDGPRVIDFGISLLHGSASLTLTGSIVGTPAFMSPEQIAGERVGTETDVFSLAGVLMYAATGRSPFGDDRAAMYRIVHEEPRLDGVPPDLRGLLTRCLAKDPAHRPALEPLLADLLSALPGGYETVPWPPRPVADMIRVRRGEVATRRGADAAVPIRSSLSLHAQALLEAGLTDALVREAVTRARV